MKKIFLRAYDKVNLGDDLFIRTIVNRYPDVKFYFWSDKINQTNFKDLKNLCVIDENSLFFEWINRINGSLKGRIKRFNENICSASVYIGGSILMQYDNWRYFTEWLLDIANRTNFFILGANFGPFSDENYRKEINTVFHKMKDVCFRDNYSKGLFLNNENVRYAPDILFDYSIPKKTIKKKQIFISVIDCNKENKIKKYNEDYINNMVNLIKQYIFDDYKIILCSFCKYEGDLEVILDIKNRVGSLGNKIQVLSYEGTNYNDILINLSESEFVIATRFHAIMLSLKAQKPVLPIIYSDKTKNVLNDLNFNSLTYDIRSKDIWNYEAIKKSMTKYYDLDDYYIQDSRLHFKVLDELIYKGVKK